jgi:phenylacetic acid degradation operon negative regulatory protein
LGADQPRLTVAQLVAIASLFGISAGASRTCLWRMVSNGELTSDNGSYSLTGHLLARRERVDDASRRDEAVNRGWDGTWELAVVRLDRRSAVDRLELRKAATALHLAELREGIWIRPDNLDPQRAPTARAVLDRQCIHFHSATSDIAPEVVASLFNLATWSRDARRLIAAMVDELSTNSAGDDSAAALAHQFALSIAAVRHLELDPLLPPELIVEEWPGASLRGTYREFDSTFKQRLYETFA